MKVITRENASEARQDRCYAAQVKYGTDATGAQLWQQYGIVDSYSVKTQLRDSSHPDDLRWLELEPLGKIGG